jgi:ketosteroid isomerase-like protein
MSNRTDEPEIIQLFVDGDRALIGADISELKRIYADDYIQYDERGRATAKEGLIRNLTSGALRFVSMKSKGRQVRFVAEDFAIVQGAEEDEIDQGGARLPVNYLYMDVVIKRDGRWQIVASQLVKRLDANSLTADR